MCISVYGLDKLSCYIHKVVCQHGVLNKYIVVCFCRHGFCYSMKINYTAFPVGKAFGTFEFIKVCNYLKLH